MKSKFTSLFLVLLIALFNDCTTQKDSPTPVLELAILNEVVTLNPSGHAPLTASITIETTVATKVSIKVAGKHGGITDVIKDFNDFSTAHTIPVLGLYANFDNSVIVDFIDAGGTTLLGTTSYTIKTGPLPTGVYPDVSIDTRQAASMADGMTFVSYLAGSAPPFYPFIFDAYGEVRWYLDYSAGGELANLFYDDGMERLQNGNFYFGDTNSNSLYEIDFMGEILNTWALPGYQFHHNVQEKPNGNFLVTVSKQGASTVEDYIIEIDRNTKQIINTWNLNISLQYNRQTLTTDVVDWIHVNALIYDPSDNSIIISGRTQGVVKLDQNNNVVWILGCHKGWGISGSGADLTNYLLQPLDASNQPITDQDVLDGNINHSDFEWNWYQHAPLLMPNGHLMVFDNGGDNRNFSGSGQYSRAVEYEINASAKTVKQKWAYGKARGAATFSHIVSDVDFLSSENHVIFSPGAVNNSSNYGKVIELNYATQAIVFEATLTPQQTFYGITFHRTERLTLYP